jgi:hypothetical protein
MQDTYPSRSAGDLLGAVHEVESPLILSERTL